jgi:hypothetical protein
MGLPPALPQGPRLRIPRRRQRRQEPGPLTIPSARDFPLVIAGSNGSGQIVFNKNIEYLDSFGGEVVTSSPSIRCFRAAGERHA